MHECSIYFELDPWMRQFHQNNISFSICVSLHRETSCWALSATMKWCMARALPQQDAGDDWQKFANVRRPAAFMWDPSRQENHLQ